MSPDEQGVGQAAGAGAPSFESIRDLVRSGERGALVTVIDGEGLGRKLLVTRGRVEGSLGDEALDTEAVELARELIGGEESAARKAAGRELLIDVFAPQPHLVIVGAVDFAGALAKLAKGAGFRVTVVDARSHFATEERIPDADRIVVSWPQDYLAGEPPNDATYVAVLTHEPRFDDPTLTAALRSDAAYIGAMGSRRAHRERLERLREAGFDDVELARISGPIGLDIGAATTEETAISILGEVIAARRGRAGGRLSLRAHPVHSFTEREPLAEGSVPVDTTPEVGGPPVPSAGEYTRPVNLPGRGAREEAARGDSGAGRPERREEGGRAR